MLRFLFHIIEKRGGVFILEEVETPGLCVEEMYTTFICEGDGIVAQLKIG
jgi:hypothetical protein